MTKIKMGVWRHNFMSTEKIEKAGVAEKQSFYFRKVAFQTVLPFLQLHQAIQLRQSTQ